MTGVGAVSTLRPSPSDITADAHVGEHALLEPAPYTMAGLSGILAEVHGLLAQGRSQDTRDGISDVHQHRRERVESEERIQRAMEEAKKEREETSFWDVLGDVLELGAVAMSAVATVATLGTGTPVLLGIGATLFSEVESKTEFLEAMGVAHDSAQIAVIGANCLSLGMMVTGSTLNIASHARDYRAYVSEGLHLAGAFEEKLHFIEHAGGSAAIGAAIGTAGQAAAALLTVGHLSNGNTNILGNIADGIAGGSQVGAGIARMEGAAQMQASEKVDAKIERERGERTHEQMLEDRAIDDLKLATGEWERAMRALASAIHEIGRASDSSIVRG